MNINTNELCKMTKKEYGEYIFFVLSVVLYFPISLCIHVVFPHHLKKLGKEYRL